MFRPISTIGHQISLRRHSKDFIRNKVVRPASQSVLKPAEKLKLYNKENKELFGPLLEKSKQKKQRSQKAVTANNSSVAKENSASAQSNETVFKIVQQENKNATDLIGYSTSYNPVLPLDIFRRKIMQNTRSCVNIVGVLINNGGVRNCRMFASNSAPYSSPAQQGYASDDKILQIKPYKNDFTQIYPSVTLILNKTMNEESRMVLEKWKQEKISELGEEEFKKYYEGQMALGSKFHSTLKDYFTKPRSELRIQKDVEGMWTSVADVLKHISSPKAIESNVVHPVLKYRGIFDAIADYEDKPTLIEWKKSDKLRKSISLTYDNPVQLAAYFGAVCNDLNYKHLNVRDALLVIAYTDGSKADVYHLSTDKLREHWAQWLSRLEKYQEKFGQDAEKRLAGGKRLFEEDMNL